ncbi:MAG: hypothetical protein CMH54_14540 [Myxococcales bacterium]|nr:hypothetical protein [Myxococcales bacterium]
MMVVVRLRRNDRNLARKKLRVGQLMKDTAIWNVRLERWGRWLLPLILVGIFTCSQQVVEVPDTTTKDTGPSDAQASDTSETSGTDDGDSTPADNLVVLDAVAATMEKNCQNTGEGFACDGRYIFHDKGDDYVVNFSASLVIQSGLLNPEPAEAPESLVSMIEGRYWDEVGGAPAGMNVQFLVTVAGDRTQSDTGTLIINGEQFSVDETLSLKDLGNLHLIAQSRFGVALSQIPLELGCMASQNSSLNLLHNAALFGGLLLPWQTALKYLVWDDTVRSPYTANNHLFEGGEDPELNQNGGEENNPGIVPSVQQSCTYFAPEINMADPEGNLSWPQWNHPVALVFSHVHPMPMAIGIFPFEMPTEEQLNGFNGGMNIGANDASVQSDSDATFIEDCSGACGQGCHNENCTIEVENTCGETPGEFKQMITVRCETHSLCESSDSCIQKCNLAAAGLAEDALEGVQSFAASGCRARCLKEACFGAEAPDSLEKCIRLLFGGTGAVANSNVPPEETLVEYTETVTYSSSNDSEGADGMSSELGTLPDALVEACCEQCDDGLACTLDCHEQTGTCLEANDPNRLQDSLCVQDDNPCTERVCKGEGTGGANDGCRTENKDGEPCGDDDLCNGAEVCSAGACEASDPVVCPPSSSPCTSSFCVPSTGDCIEEELEDSEPCDDNNVCTEGDECVGGACVGDEEGCNDDKFCTEDSCDPVTGCNYTIQDGTCEIDDECYWAAESDPNDSCYICNPSVSKTEWTQEFYPCPED